jgi:simple sugar transport system permease protein
MEKEETEKKKITWNTVKEKLFSFVGTKGFHSFISSILCVLIGVFVGFILMLIASPSDALEGLGVLLSKGASSTAKLARVIYKSTPMILSGLSIAFSFKLGLFNIGITGQLTFGAFIGVILGISGYNRFFCIIVATISGGLVGLLTGFLKAKFNVNEVLSGIMLNWIIYYLIGFIGKVAIPSSYKDQSQSYSLKSLSGSALLPSLGSNLDIGIIIAIMLVVTMWIVLNKTTLGFELKMSGSNKYAAQYVGIKQDKNIILALTVSGALAGMCGYMIYAQPSNSGVKFMWDSSSNSLLSDGFTGISVALIAQNSPIGCIFSAMLLNYIDAAKTSLTVISSTYNSHCTELISAVIIYFASFASFFNMIFAKVHEKLSGVLLFERRVKNVK